MNSSNHHPSASTSPFQAAGRRPTPRSRCIRLLFFPIHTFIITSSFLITAVSSLADEVPRFIPATPENTRHTDGSALPAKKEDAGWKWLVNQGIESIPHPKQAHHILTLTATGLEPGKLYEVHGVFRLNANANQPMKNRAVLPAGFGLTMASIHYFDGKTTKEAPWLITPDTEIGKAYGLNTLPATSERFRGLTGLDIQTNAQTLAFSQLGAARAATDGTIPVFISAFPHVGGKGRTVVDGLVIQPAGDDAALPHALNPATILHLAIRAGDSVTLDRALDAGVDINSLDEEGLTPLFYASATADAALVRKLLDRGADPNVTEQSVPPLTAAATFPSEEITPILIEAGANVPATPYESNGKLHLDIDPRFIHPLVAAIRAGSLPVAKLLADQVPDLNIESLFPPLDQVDALNMGPRYVFDPKETFPMPFIVAGAAGSGHWDLAEWLLRKGCKPVVPSPGSIHYYDGNEHPHVNLMIWAVVAGEKAMPFLETMIRQGHSPVIQRKHAPAQLYVFSKYSLMPWDALSAACFTGNATLVAKFLPLASDVDSTTQELLLSLAMYCENADVLRLVREQFPNANPPRYTPEAPKQNEASAVESDESIRILLPRTKPLPPRASRASDAPMTLAVIAAPEAAGPGDALAAFASMGDAWKVVDRNDVEAALAEKNHAKPWSDGTHQLADLGDQLAADTIIVASKIVGQSLSIFRFEVVEVATGLEIHREYFQEQEMNLEADLKSFLSRAESAMQMAHAHERKQAVTVIAFTAHESLTNSKTLARVLRSAVRAKIDESPGFISLSRSQSGRLMEEQAMAGNQSVWAAAHLIEAAIRPESDGRITVAMRLETLKEGQKIRRDAEATGTVNELPELAAKVWEEASRHGQAPDQPTRQNAASIKKNAQLEAERLVREIEWMMMLGADVREIEPMVESAFALGASLDKLVPLHLDLLFRKSRVFDHPFSHQNHGRFVTRLSELSLGSIVQQIPIPLEISDQVIHALPAFTELLHYTSFYMQKLGIEGVNYPSRNFPNYGSFANNQFWYTIQFLAFVRASVYQDTLTAAQRQEFDAFGRELDTTTKTYFDLIIQSMKKKRRASIRMESLDKMVLLRNPEIVKGLARAARTPRIYVMLDDLDNARTNLVRRYDFTTWLNPQELIARMILEQTPAKPSEYETVVSMMAKCILAAPHERASHFQEIARSSASMSDQGSSAVPGINAFNMLVQNHTLGTFFDGFKDELPAHHGSKVLPHLIHAPRPAPDFFMRRGMYTSTLSSFNASLAAGSYKVGIGRQKFPSRLNQTAKNHLASGQREKLKSLYDAALTWEMISGELVAKSFADAHQLFSEDESEKSSLHAELVVDMSVVDPGFPGTFHHVQRDLRDPSNLWLKYLPFQNETIAIDENGDGAEHLLRRKPWLLEIHGTEFTIKTRINLGEAQGMSPDQNLPGWTRRFRASPIVQTTDRFIANASWITPNAKADNQFAVMIEKKTGSITPLAGGLFIIHDQVVALGDDLYFLHEDHQNRSKDARFRHPNILYHIDAKGEIRALTQFGRRPEVTPFDAEDLSPRNLGVRGDRLFVGNSRDYFGEYDPKDQTWAILRSKTKEERQVFWDATLRQSPPPEPIASGRGWSIDHTELFPGALHCSHPKHGKKKIGIQTAIPAGFIDRIQYASKGPRNEVRQSATIQIVSHAEHIKNHPLRPVVLNQTPDHLMLGLQFQDRYDKSSRFLPFLWRVSKEDVLQHLK